MELDDATLVGLPRRSVAGNRSALRSSDSIAIDQVGFRYFLPGPPLSTREHLDIEDKMVTVGAVVDASPPFVNLPVVYARHSEAIGMVGQEPRQLSFILCEPEAGRRWNCPSRKPAPPLPSNPCRSSRRSPAAGLNKTSRNVRAQSKMGHGLTRVRGPERICNQTVSSSAGLPCR